MPASPPRRRFTLADVMILVASVAGLFGVIPACVGMAWMEPLQAGIQSAITSIALFVSLGGLGACVARWRGRPRFEGFCLAFIGGPFGMAMIALMPDLPLERPAETDTGLRALRG
jgi:hypothetical protein